MHNPRRERFIAYVDAHLKGSREALMAKTGLTKGRVSQLFDENQPFGDVAARNLAERLGLPLDYFDRDHPPERPGGTRFHYAAVLQRPPAAAPAERAPPDDLVYRALKEVAASLQRMSPVQRAAATGALHHLLEDPSSWEEVAAQITRITDTGNAEAA